MHQLNSGLPCIRLRPWLRSTLVSLGLLTAGLAVESSTPSPVNQVFQFFHEATCTAWSDGSTNKASSYLWIPERCQKVRGLLILCANVPEHLLVGHPAIREVCTANDLGIVWSVPSFMNWAKPKTPGGKKMSDERDTTVAFLQQLLDGLAKTSGYAEVATVPWLPIGESGHLLMVDALVEEKPERCIAGMWLKNNHTPPKNRTVPAFVAYGTAQEWSQDKTDIRTKWAEIDKAYDGILNLRKASPAWPLTYLIDGSSGHFDCSERLVRYCATYIDQVTKARLGAEGGSPLKPLDLTQGFVTDLPVPGHEGKPITKAGAKDALPWYFDEAGAKEAQAIAAINWKAATQFPVYLDAQGKELDHSFNGISKITTATFEADGLTFTVRGKLADKIPAGFLGAGEPLATTPGEPVAEWLCGPLEPLGGGRFRIALDRTWPGAATYVALRQPGNDSVRGVVQPAGVEVKALRNTAGKAQKITWSPLADVPVGTKDLTLKATSDAGLPVSYFVVAGPAVVQDGKLVFTAIPPRAKLPLEVTVAAWQWGQAKEPQVKTAEVVRTSFKILPGKP